MTWSVHLVQTMTGRVGEELKVAGDISWSIPINGIEELSATVDRPQLRQISAALRRPRNGSLLLCWESETVGRVPWILAPISSPITEDPVSDTAKISCKGLGFLLENRFVLDDEFLPEVGTPSAAAMKNLTKSTFSRKGYSLGTIAQDIVKAATAKTGGYLPIRYGTPRETGAGLNERNYEGFNLANIGAWKLLTELSEVTNGPDFTFRPEYVDGDEAMVRWVMYNGTVAQPTIHQTSTLDLDTTAPIGPVASVSPTRSSTNLTSRVYWTGAGEGAGILLRAAQDLSRLRDYTPLVETVGSTSDSENASLIQAHANAALADGKEPLTQLSVSMDGADRSAEIGTWFVGDSARVTVKGWLDIKDGTTQRRIISAKGSSSTEVTLEFQEDTW